MTKQKGFTLIELVVVIVILGILAVTAAPRFLNLQSDARESSLQGLKGAMAGAGSIVYGKSAIEGKETESTETVEGIAVVYGYPAATSAGIGAAVDGISTDWQVVSGATPGISYTFSGQDTTSWSVTDGCLVQYQEPATSVAIPSITVVSTKC